VEQFPDKINCVTLHLVEYVYIRKILYTFIMLNHVPCIFILYLLQPTNAQIYITIFSLYIMFISTCFDTSVSTSRSFKNFYSAKLHEFLQLKHLELKFHKIIRLKYYFVVADTNTSQRLAIQKFEPRSSSLKPLTLLRRIARVLSLHINQEITID